MFSHRRMKPARRAAFCFGFFTCVILLTLQNVQARQSPQALFQVQATVETAPVHSSGDAADDPCIWIHPFDPSLSTIIGTDKKGGLAVYDLQGNELQYITGIKPNNVDIRYNFPLGNAKIDLVCFSDYNGKSVGMFKVNPETRRLENVMAGRPDVNLSVYGFCMYRSPFTGKFYFFINSKRGEVEQWELIDNGAGLVAAVHVRNFSVSSQVEGCVADDEFGTFYLAEEDVGIWKFNAEPGGGSDRILIDSITGGKHLEADVEGLSIYYASDSTGYLLASSQGSSKFVVYAREGSNSYVATFEVTAGAVDEVSGTDGIDVTNYPLGAQFPFGAFVMQDGSNQGNQNFKLVPWEAIANAAPTPLKIDTKWNPRRASGSVSTEPVIVAFSPLSASINTQVLLLGANFQNTVQVAFGGVPATHFSVESENRILAVVPAGAKSGKISISTLHGNAVSTSDFTVTVESVPNAPGILSATSLSASAILLAWQDNSTNEAGFKIERKNPGAANFVEIATTGPNTLSYKDTTLTASSTYTYRVRAFNANGNSAYSAEATTTTKSAGTSFGLNLARDKPVAASSSNANYPAENAVDGDVDSYWRSEEIDPGAPAARFDVDLGDSVRIDHIIIRWKGKFYAPEYELLVSQDSTNWQTLYSTQSGTRDDQYLTLPPTSARYCRLHFLTNNSTTYRIEELEVYGDRTATSVAASGRRLPSGFSLWQNYPNPFNPATRIGFQLPVASFVSVRVFNLLGKLVSTVYEGEMQSGPHEITWQSPIASGVYFYELSAKGLGKQALHFHARKKMTVLK